MTLKTRKEVRETLGTLLSAALTGAGNPAQSVYDYLKSTFDGESPVVCVGSGSILAEEFHMGGSSPWAVTYGYSLYVFVTREDEQVAEDALDNTTQELLSTLQSNRTYSSYWQALSFREPSNIIAATVGGEPYWLEVVPIAVEVFE